MQSSRLRLLTVLSGADGVPAFPWHPFGLCLRQPTLVGKWKRHGGSVLAVGGARAVCLGLGQAKQSSALNWGLGMCVFSSPALSLRRHLMKYPSSGNVPLRLPGWEQ